MGAAAEMAPTVLVSEIQELFYQRTRICLWLGTVFFSCFSLLDFICCRPFFGLFLSYRLTFVLLLLCIIQLLKHPEAKRYTRFFMYFAMLLGSVTISLMTLPLGGFISGYYVGILLMIAGGFSVLPLNVSQSFLWGSSVYLVYAVTVYLGSHPLDTLEWGSLVNNTFFFFFIIIVTAVQCFDEIRTQLKSLRATRSLQTMNNELKQYTGNLEALVRQRMELLEESDLKFRDLYNNILDLVLLIDQDGSIREVNYHGAALLGLTQEDLEGEMLTQFVCPEKNDCFVLEVIGRLRRGEEVRNVQVQMQTIQGRTIEVELSGKRVDIPGQSEQYQLIIRDITATKAMERRVLESNQLLDTSRQAAIFGLARLAECRDDGTGAHLLRIREYTRILATELINTPGLEPVVTEHFIEDLCLSSVLHDIGKVGISDAILLKPDRLTEREFEIMKLHCQYGGTALSGTENDAENLSFLRTGREIALFHHERWDGSGYPNGLAGIDIPLSARIIALADVYDALTSSRSYKPAYTHEHAHLLIVQESGYGFDPMIVGAFLRSEHKFKKTRESFSKPDARGY